MEKPTKSMRVSAGTRIYYLDAHKDPKGHPYLVMTEEGIASQHGKRKRQRIFIHAEDLTAFKSAFDEMAEHITTNSNG